MNLIAQYLERYSSPVQQLAHRGWHQETRPEELLTGGGRGGGRWYSGRVVSNWRWRARCTVTHAWCLWNAHLHLGKSATWRFVCRGPTELQIDSEVWYLLCHYLFFKQCNKIPTKLLCPLVLSLLIVLWWVRGDSKRGFFLRWWKRSKVDCAHGCILVNILKPTELYTFKRGTIWYIKLNLNQPVFQNKKINVHILRSGEVILSSLEWVDLNWMLTRTACSWPIKHTPYICFNYQRKAHTDQKWRTVHVQNKD